MILVVKLFFIILSLVNSSSIFNQYYEEAKIIAQSMSLEQKIGQTIQADIQIITDRDKQQTDPTLVQKYFFGSLLISGMAAPTKDGNLATLPSNQDQDKLKQAFMQATAQNWKKFTDRLNNVAINITTKDQKKYSIKLLLGSDAVHGDQHTLGTVLFPHNIGLSCTHNQKNFQNIGYWVQNNLNKVGFNWAFAPTVAVSHNPQWGRYYQTLGQEDDYILKYGQSFTQGLQTNDQKYIQGVLGCAKHFLGDGSTLYGTNMGNANIVNMTNYLNHNTPGYSGAINKGIGSIMASFSAINYIPNAFNSLHLMGLLRQNLNFGGFTISDFNQLIDQDQKLLPRSFLKINNQNAYSMLINAGIDMIMLSCSTQQLQQIINTAKIAIGRQKLLQDRLQEAVTRILQVKLAMQLITLSSEQVKKPKQKLPPHYSSGDIYMDSLQAVQQSLVLLKNQKILPMKQLKSSIKYVILVGQQILNLNQKTNIQLFRSFDNIGMQCGGWSIQWQGFEGNYFWSDQLKKQSNASSILDALSSMNSNLQLLYTKYSSQTNRSSISSERQIYLTYLKTLRIDMNYHNTLILSTLGEFPYAQNVGDVNIPYCKTQNNPACQYYPSANIYAPSQQSQTLQVSFSDYDLQIIDVIRQFDKRIPMISVLLSGRPMIINNIMTPSDAIIAAWLPGTSGGSGIINSIVGDYIIKPKNSNVNTLSMDWPSSMDSLKNFPIYGSNGDIPTIMNPLFTVGYGLSTDLSSQILSQN